MKKIISILLALLFLSACTQDIDTESDLPLIDADWTITQEYVKENLADFYLDLSGLGLTRVPDFSEILDDSTREDILYLNLAHNSISEMSDDLMVLPNLKELKMDNNQITKLENLDGIALLSRVDLYKNQISEVELANIPTLSKLDLSYNALTGESMQGIFALKGLNDLQLQHNQIDSIEGIEMLDNLKLLRLEYNELTEVSALEALTNLEKVTLGKNQLDEEVVERWKEIE